MTNYIFPNYDTWDRYEVEIIKYCTSLESARKSAADATYNTTDEERLGRGKRQHVLYHRFSSDEEEESYKEKKKFKMNKKQLYSSIPASPENFALNYDCSNDTNVNNDVHQNEMRSDHDKENLAPEQSQQLELSNVPIILEEYNPPAQSLQNSKMQESISVLLRMQAMSNLKLQEIKQRISNLENLLKQNKTSVVSENTNLIAHFLPLNSIEMIKELELQLKLCDEAVTQFKEFLIKIGGNNPRDNIHRLLKKTFTNECGLHCSWKGIRNNFKLSNLYLIKIMQREITSRYTDVTDMDFENITAEWFRFAWQRKNREEKNQEREQE